MVRHWERRWFGLAAFLQLLQKGSNSDDGEHSQDQQKALVFTKYRYGKKQREACCAQSQHPDDLVYCMNPVRVT